MERPTVWGFGGLSLGSKVIRARLPDGLWLTVLSYDVSLDLMTRDLMVAASTEDQNTTPQSNITITSPSTAKYYIPQDWRPRQMHNTVHKVRRRPSCRQITQHPTEHVESSPTSANSLHRAYLDPNIHDTLKRGGGGTH